MATNVDDPSWTPSGGSPAFVAQRVASTLRTAAEVGLMTGTKTKRVSGRAHQQLFAAAAQNSGLDGNDLLEYALARVALDDGFAQRLEELEGTIASDVDLEF